VGGVVVENNDGEKDRWRLGEYLCDGIVMKSTAKKKKKQNNSPFFYFLTAPHQMRKRNGSFYKQQPDELKC
jgi:hypothetical protein